MLLIVYARVGLTQLYSMIVLFTECWESKLLIKVRVEKLNGDLHQPSGIRYVSRSFSVRCFISLAYWEGIDFCGYSVCCGTPQATRSILRKTYIYNLNKLQLWVGVTEKTSYGLGYHNRQSNRRNQSFPICKRNQTSNNKGSWFVHYSKRLM